MATDAQIQANRENAKKSTGPRTPEGKARVSKNALKHGLLAQDSVIPGEDPAEFDRHLTTYQDTYFPRNCVEKEIVRQGSSGGVRGRSPNSDTAQQDRTPALPLRVVRDEKPRRNRPLAKPGRHFPPAAADIFDTR